MNVELIESMGSDLTVTNSARVSFDKHKDVFDEKDERLITFLADNEHTSPFRHCFATFRVAAPIFVARQLVKHQVGLAWNEVSRRYVSSRPELYFPEIWRQASVDKKQGSTFTPAKYREYGIGICFHCKAPIEKKSTGPLGKWCSEACRTKYRKENSPDFRLHSVKTNALKRGLEYSLEPGDVEWVTKCPLLGIELDYSVSEGRNPDNSPSVDRIDPSKGYVKGNVWVISNKANRMKNDASKEELLAFCKNSLTFINGYPIPDTPSIEDVCNKMVDFYEHLLSEGVCPEQARMVLPLNTYTSWYWSGSLQAFAHVCNLRCKPDAQVETKVITDKIDEICKGLWPCSWQALRSSSESLSKKQKTT